MLVPSQLTPTQQRAWRREVAALKAASAVAAERVWCPVPCAAEGELVLSQPLEVWASR